MPDTNDEIQKLLTDVQQYLREERELFGDYIYPEPSVEPSMTSKKQATPREHSASVPSGEQDLFGGPVTPAPQGKSGAIAESLMPYPNEPWVKATSLDALNTMICTCTKCPLGFTRTKFVFGVGNPKAEIVVVGEAPGADEDAQGEPFVGRAGKLLNKILEAINFKREEVYICNILKCRPPGNRDPQPDEVEACIPHLWKQIEIIKPKLILCLGRISAQMLLKTNASLGDMRGKVHDYRGIKMIVTYHPAALLRNPNWKRPAWEDVQKLRKMYDEMKAGA